MQRPTFDDWLGPAFGAWVASVLGEDGAAVTVGPPGADGGPPSQAARAPRGVNLHLLSIAPHDRATTPVERGTELRLVLRYLATSWAAERAAADALLCALALQLLERGSSGTAGRFELAVEPPPSQEVLGALGLPPRPALVLALVLTHVERAALAPRVTQPPATRAAPTGVLAGTLVGPDDVPIASAQVALPALGRITETGPAGQFQIIGVPAELAGLAIRIRARGVERSFQLPSTSGGDPLILRMSFAKEG